MNSICSLVCSLVLLCHLSSSSSFSIKTEKLKSKSQTCPDPCGKCNLGKDGMINVHLVPHTHDDVGWLKTVDQYYYGSNTAQQEASVQYILDTVVAELAKDPSKRFIYVEIAYFWRWWNEQNEETKRLVRQLVDERRLEFTIGAWCMNDEGTTYYQDMIDQQTLGLQFILSEFGECARPRAAWQIDPFGHSREQASLFAQFGFDGLFLGRVDYQDKDYRSRTKTLEMVWQASSSLGDRGKIFTGILPNLYQPPDGFCFDQYCGDEPIMDDARLEEYNVNQKVDDFLKATMTEANMYQTSNLIMTMGSDFQFSNAHMWYKNLDKLIYYVNQRQLNGTKVNIFYSTPSCYLSSLNKANVTWPTKTDDFFPYAIWPHGYLTGFFTSRTTLKYYVRQTNNFLQVTRHIAAISRQFDDRTKEAIGVLSRAMSVAQHHDAISGTERQHVANDYARRLSDGTDKGVEVIYNAFQKLSMSEGANYTLSDEDDLVYCSLLNITECLPIENKDGFASLIYNPLARQVDVWIRVPVVTADYVVYDQPAENEVPSEYVPISNETRNLPDRKSKANYELLFKATLPPTNFIVFFIRKGNSKGATSEITVKRDNFVIENDHLSLQFDSNGNLIGLNNLNQDLKTNAMQNYCFYKSMVGNNSDSHFQASGAYVFRPDGDNECMSVSQYEVHTGKSYQEVRQIYNDWISQTIRLYDDAQYAEFEWQVGPIDVEDHVGKEVIVKFASDLNSDSTFYTDANGREVLKRVRDFRPSWPHFNQTESIAGNYYPVNSRIFIKDEHLSSRNDVARQLTLVTDRSHGGSSIEDGSIEVMLHRRLVHDDGLGVSEPLNEPGSDNKGLIARGKFYVFFNTTQNSVRLHRSFAHAVNTQPLVTFINYESNNQLNGLNKIMDYKILSSELPENVHLLSFLYDFDNDHGNSLIVRLEHFYEINEDPDMSKPAIVDLLALFSETFNILGVEELTLGANMPVSELDNRLKFKANKAKSTNSKFTSSEVTLNPMEIKTFRLWFGPKQ